EFFGGRLLRWLTAPIRNRVVGAASRPFLNMADRILGAHFLQDISEFFVLLQSMEAGFVTRARAGSRGMADSRSTFCVVTTLETAAAREAAFFVDQLNRRQLHLGAVIVNKALPAYLHAEGPAASAAALHDDAPAIADSVAAVVKAPAARIGRVLV